MKCTHKNVDIVFNILKSQLEDDNGRGEFDDESDLLSSVETIIEWIKDDKLGGVSKGDIDMKLNLQESIDFLNTKCGYIEVEKDDDYTDKEIIEIANDKYGD